MDRNEGEEARREVERRMTEEGGREVVRRRTERNEGEEGEREALPLSHPHHLSILHSFQSATSLPLLFPVILSSTSLPLSFFRLHPPY
jgi:hypothetical protein